MGFDSLSHSFGPFRRVPTQPSNLISKRGRVSVSSASIVRFSRGRIIFKSIHLISTNPCARAKRTQSSTGPLPIRPFQKIAGACSVPIVTRRRPIGSRSEEHTSELQSQSNLVCRLLLEKKKKKNNINT